ncbi:MAG TPA: CarD family transcriptional regulator, partial [Vicinamibacterales bacterium]
MSTATSSLAFRALLKSAAAASGLARKPARLSGVSPAAAALHAAVVAQDQPAVIVVPTDAEIESMVADAGFFLSVLLGWSPTDAARHVLPFPSPEVDPYRGLAPHFQVASARARALFALATGTARLVVTSARALLPRLADPVRFAAGGLVVAPGTEIPPHDLGDRLAAAGFVREDPVDEHGEFCVRGGVVDVFPSSESHPIRLEFIGDVVESVRQYDAATQRSLAAVDQLAIVPQREEMLGESGAPDRSSGLVDYVRRAGASLIVLELDDVDAHGRALETQWRTSERDMAARGRDVPPFDAIAWPWDALAAWLSSGRHVSELAVEGVAAGAAPADHVACQPAMAFHGRFGDWVAELCQANDRGDRTLFIAATAGRADRAIDLLGEYDLRARRLEGDEGPVHATVFVTTGELSRGFALPAAQLRFYAETDVFEEERHPHERQRSVVRTFLSDFRDLKVGDFVVHVDSGIGRFVGLKRLAISSLESGRSGAGEAREHEFMELRYAGDD